LSWRVTILPFLGMKDLFAKFHQDEPWDSEHNKPLVAEMPDVYRCPRSKVGDQGLTVYQVPRGPDTVFANDEGAKIRSITDGTSNTIMFVEVDDRLAEPWTKPADWTFKPADPKAGLGGHFPGIFCAGFCDSSVHAITLQIKEDNLNALFTRNGRETVTIPD
ncbi:MAG TPA: DUF1559 domain-containing protein, partial [Pirellulales bacterium]|nr:DUF1559 domain-containing protein [Pirellulales bacterium]